MKSTNEEESASSHIVRIFVRLIIRLIFRFRAEPLDGIPPHGPAVVIANHVSFVDPLLILAAAPRHIRFLMERSEMEKSPLRQILLWSGVIPVTFDNPGDRRSAFEKARQEMSRGGLVGVFPEQYVTRTGFLNAFTEHHTAMAKRPYCPIVPVYIDSMRGDRHHSKGNDSISFEFGMRRKVIIVSGRAFDPAVPVFEQRRIIEELSVRAYELRKERRRSLGYVMIRRARANWSRSALCDTTGKRVTFGKALIGALALAKAAQQEFRDESSVGIILPASVGGALLNAGLVLAGKIPVNLNFTTSSENIAQAAATCGIKTVVTSRKVLARMEHLIIPGRTLFLEDLAQSITPRDRLVALTKALFVPASVLTGEEKRRPEDCATVVFSSGSTCDPNGIVLTHHNILSNIEQMHSVIDLSRKDCMCAALPFFHSFGLTATLWFPLTAGFRVAYHTSPLDGSAIASLVRQEKGTIMLATPTFLSTYLRKAEPEDFATLWLVISGAEKLRPALARAFEEKFHIVPLEGYGATELSPVACLNIPDTELWGRREKGCRPGTVGRLLPGMCHRIEDPETGELLDPGTPGLLRVKGPNVMQGYLNQPDRTQKVLDDGWYTTGDIAAISADGFVTLTDRLSRFSKIAGEMVPHGALEDILVGALGTGEPVVAVTSVPDPVRGEKVVVLYTREAGPAEALREILEEAEIPNLWKPARDAYILVDAIPVLGTGKTDLKGVRAKARAQGCEATTVA